MHPGEVPSEELEQIGLSPAGLSRQTAVPANRISRIIWTNLQNQFELAILHAKAGKAIALLPTSLTNQSILTGLIR